MAAGILSIQVLSEGCPVYSRRCDNRDEQRQEFTRARQISAR